MKLHVGFWLRILPIGFVPLFVGVAIGIGNRNGYTHVIWPILAGIFIGLMTALAWRSHRLPAAFLGSLCGVIAGVLTVVIWQYHTGWWPITDEMTIQEYGSTAMAIRFITLDFAALVCIPSLAVAAIVALASGACRRQSKTSS